MAVNGDATHGKTHGGVVVVAVEPSRHSPAGGGRTWDGRGMLPRARQPPIAARARLACGQTTALEGFPNTCNPLQ